MSTFFKQDGGIERNWTPGQAFLPDIKPATDPVVTAPSNEAIVTMMVELVKSQQLGDDLYSTKTLDNGRIEITGPGAYMTLSRENYDIIMDLIIPAADDTTA